LTRIGEALAIDLPRSEIGHSAAPYELGSWVHQVMEL